MRGAERRWWRGGGEQVEALDLKVIAGLNSTCLSGCKDPVLHRVFDELLDAGDLREGLSCLGGVEEGR